MHDGSSSEIICETKARGKKKKKVEKPDGADTSR